MHPIPIQPQPTISNIRRHTLVVGTRGGISAFCQLPSGCTGIAASVDWSCLHHTWAAKSSRGIFSYVLSTAGGASGHINIVCADFSCIMQTSGNAMSREALRALLRPPSLSRQLIAAASYVLIPAGSEDGDSSNSTSRIISSNNNENTSVILSGGAANSVANASALQPNQQLHNNSNNNNVGGGGGGVASTARLATQQQQQQGLVMPSRSGGKHAHSNAFVVTTVFIIVDMNDARTRDVAAESAKALDAECQMLNPSMGNQPLFVFVALSDQRNNNNNTTAGGRKKTASCYPEVLLQDVLEMTQSLKFAAHRVDEVMLM